LAILGRRLFNSTLTGVFIAYLIIAGTNPLGILYAVAKVGIHGADRLCDDPNFVWGVVHARFGLIRFKDVGGLCGPLINHFLNISSRPVALASLLAMVVALEFTLKRSRFFGHVLLLCFAALTTALSPIIGVVAVGTLLVALVVVRPEGSPELAPRKMVSHVCRTLPLGPMISLIGGVLLVVPTYYHLIFGPSESQVSFGLSAPGGLLWLVTVMLSVFPLLILAYVGWRRSPPDRRSFLSCLIVSAALMLLGCIAFRLPAGNQSNCFHAAVVLLSVPAGASILRPVNGARQVVASPRRALLIGVLFVPTVLVLLSSYVGRPPVPVTFAGSRISRTHEDPQWEALYRWVRSETQPRAVFILDPGSPIIAFCGNTTEFPAATGRSIFTEQLRHYLVSPYPDAKRRADMAADIVSGRQIDASNTRYLQSLDRPLYVLLTQAEDMSEIERLSQRYGPPVFRRGALCVFKYSYL
jgi:hypothetical protein